MDTQELCFTARDVNITPGGVFDDNGIANLDTFFTGESSFQADEVEVFVVAGGNQKHLFIKLYILISILPDQFECYRI